MFRFREKPERYVSASPFFKSVGRPGKLLLGALAAIALLCGGMILYARLASDPEIGAGIAYGHLGGDARIAIALCRGEEVRRISVYASEAERPPRASLLWEVRDPVPGMSNQRVFTIGDSNGFREEPTQLSTALPRSIQVEYEYGDGGTDAVMADRDDLFKLKGGPMV